MKHLKRVIAILAMLAVLLPSFVFAEEMPVEIAEEIIEAMAAEEVFAAEVPAEEIPAAAQVVEEALIVEETPAEEAPAEESAAAEASAGEDHAEDIPAEDTPAEEAGSEASAGEDSGADGAPQEPVSPADAECIHKVYCMMPDVCIECGQMVTGIEAQHVDNLYQTDLVPVPDDPNLHAYQCPGCMVFVYPEAHYVDCRLPDTSVCSVCFAPVASTAVTHGGLDPEGYQPIEGTDRHSIHCFNCGEDLYEDAHYVDCMKEDTERCEICHAPVSEEYVAHHYEDGVCIKCGSCLGVERVVLPGSLSLGLGESYELPVRLEPFVPAEIGYLCSDDEIVAVDEDGMLTALKRGSVSIMVTAIGADGIAVSDTVKVTVKSAPETIRLSEKSIGLFVGQRFRLEAGMDSSSAAQLIWRSNNPVIARVDESGAVTAIAKGEAVISVSTYNGKTASCTVKVTGEPAYIGVEDTTLKLYYKQSFDLDAKLMDADGVETAGTLRYESSDPDSVSVSASGRITVKKSTRSTAIVSITSENGLRRDVYVSVCTVPDKVSLPEKEISLIRGETYQIRPIIGVNEATVFSYSSSKKAAASVDGNGLVTAVDAGKATITVKTHNGKRATLKVTVTDPYAPEGVELRESGSLYAGLNENLQLSATLQPETAVSELKWTSSKPKTVSVDANGVITPLKLGSAVITVKTHNGKKDTVTIKVVNPDVASEVVLSKSGTFVLPLGESAELKATVFPATARADLSWSVSGKGIAAVDGNGVVTPLKPGSATITVKTDNGKKDTVKLRVVDPKVVDSVTLEPGSTQTINIGEPLQLSAAVYPATAETTLTWTSSSKKYATVDANGLVTPIAKGSTTITVKAKNGKKDTVRVKVTDDHKPTSISLTGLEGLTVGDQATLVPVLEPANALTRLTWKSSNKNVLTVDAGGAIHAVGVGTATITVETHNGKEAKVRLTVGEPPKATAIDVSLVGNGVLGISESTRVVAKVLPEDAVYTLSYASSDTVVADVDAGGRVTGISAGRAIITVTADNGVQGSVELIVDANRDPDAGIELGGAISGVLSSADKLLGGLVRVEETDEDGSVRTYYTDSTGTIRINWGMEGDQVKRIELLASGSGRIYGVGIGMRQDAALAALEKNGVRYSVDNGSIIGVKPGVANMAFEINAEGVVGYISAFLQ